MTAVGWDPDGWDDEACTGPCCQTPTDTTSAPDLVEPPDWPSFVHQLTSEQRGRMRRAMANLAKGLQQFAEAFAPAGQTAAQSLAQIAEAYRYEPKQPGLVDD